MKEKERSVKDECFYTIFGWMTNPKKMNLSGLELQLFAIVFGFCQSQPLNGYYASTNYLAEFTGATPRGVRKAMESLIKKGYIIRMEQEQYHTYKYIALVPDFDEKKNSSEEGENCPEQNAEEMRNNVPDEELSSQDEELSSADEEHSSTNNILNNINISNKQKDKKESQSFGFLSDCPHVDLTLSEVYYLTRYYGRELTQKYIKRLENYLVKTGKQYNYHLEVIENWIYEDNPYVRSDTCEPTST